MRSIPIYLLLFAATLAISTPVHAQADTQASTLLGGSLKAFGGEFIRDVTLTGTANRIPSSNHDNVSTTLKAMASGTHQISYETASGPLVETRVIANNGIWAGSWSEPTGTKHTIAAHNMMTEPVWFFPELTLRRGLRQANGGLVSYIGKETFQATPVEHLRFVANASASPQLQTWSQTDLYLDAVSLLPVAMTYNDHPDNNVLVDIPVTVLYTNYIVLGGVMLPTHVQQLRNNALFVDLHIESVQMNTGMNVELPQ